MPRAHLAPLLTPAADLVQRLARRRAIGRDRPVHQSTIRHPLAFLLVTQAACAEPSVPPASSATPANAAPAMAPSDVGAFFDCLRERGYTVVGAHRGGPVRGFAENA